MHPSEKAYLQARQVHISQSESFRKILGLSAEEHIDPQDVPIVALAGSGGG
jgi:hypothetical protein